MPIPAPPPSLTVSSGPALSETGDTGGLSDTGHTFNFNGGKSGVDVSTMVFAGVVGLLGLVWITKR